MFQEHLWSGLVPMLMDLLFRIHSQRPEPQVLDLTGKSLSWDRRSALEGTVDTMLLQPGVTATAGTSPGLDDYIKQWR